MLATCTAHVHGQPWEGSGKSGLQHVCKRHGEGPSVQVVCWQIPSPTASVAEAHDGSKLLHCSSTQG